MSGINYTHLGGGMAWRFVGSRPVSALADQVMLDCGMAPLGLEQPQKKPKRRKTPKRRK